MVLGGALDVVAAPLDVVRAAAPHDAFIDPEIDHANVGVEGTASRDALHEFLSRT